MPDDHSLFDSHPVEDGNQIADHIDDGIALGISRTFALTKPAQIGRYGTKTRVRDRRHLTPPQPPHVWKAMREEHGRPLAACYPMLAKPVDIGMMMCKIRNVH
jgi:hypothetical protein